MTIWQPEPIRFEFRGAARQMFECRHKEILLEGPAGTGKTRAILQKIHACLIRYPGARALMLRKHRSMLTETMMVTLERDVLVGPYSGIKAGRGRGHRSDYTYPNGSQIILGGIAESERYMGGEYDIAYLGEGTEAEEHEWEDVVSRLRSWKMPFQQGIIDCNPKGPGHWLNIRADRMVPRSEDDPTLAPLMMRFRSRHEDNPRYDTPEGKEYLRTLASLSGIKRARLYEGRWVASEGIIYDTFKPSQHVRPVDPAIIGDARIIIGVDDAVTVPFAALRALWRDGHLYIERAVYRTKLLEQEKVQAIKGLAHGAEVVIVDPAAAGLKLALRKAGLHVRDADNEVIAGIERTRQMFADDAITIDPSCVDLIRELELYEWADNTKREVPIKENDHACDSLRYIVQTLGLVGAKVYVEPPQPPPDPNVNIFEESRKDPMWGFVEVDN